MSLRYEAPSEISKAEFLRAIEAGVVSVVCQAIVSAVHYIEDYGWLVDQFTLLLDHSDESVRGVTATCVGHLARLHSNSDRAQLLLLLERRLSDPLIVGQVEDAIDDVNMYG